MAEYHLQLPLSSDQVKTLHVGDVVYLSGQLFTARDRTHQLLLDKQTIDVPLDQMALYHSGPLLKKVKKEWMVVSAGPTTSSRMDAFGGELLERFKVKVIIGKGGMGLRTQEALKHHGAVYLAFPGGAGVLAADHVIQVDDVLFLKELGMPEALWVFTVDCFGPLVVAMDAHGASLYK